MDQLPRSRAAADLLRPKKTVFFEIHDSGSVYEDVFSQNNPMVPPAQATARSSRNSRTFRKSPRALNSNTKKGAEVSERLSVNVEDHELDKASVLPGQTSTFDEMKLSLSKVHDQLEGLCNVSHSWESDEKREIRLLGAGLSKDEDGNWRDIDGALTEPRE